MQTVKVEVKLINGDTYNVEYEEGRQAFLDAVSYADRGFIQDVKQTYISIKNIISFKFKGE